MARIYAVDVIEGGAVTIHQAAGSTTYADWDTFLAAQSLSDVEGINNNIAVGRGWDGRTSSGGSAPLTAMPSEGSTKRAAGQGCTNCVYRNGCLAIIGRREGLSDDCGTKCDSYSAAS